MTNTNLFLLFGTSLSLIPSLTFAQCVATQDCATLGYTETSCNGGSGVKCPFGNSWACFKSESEIKQELEKEFCNEYGFTLTCTGTGETGGIGKACGGKYNYCACAANFTWNPTTKACEANTANCVIGALYYSDGTCSRDKISSKTLLGVVIYEKSASQMGWIMTVKPIATGIIWSTEYKDIPGLSNCTSESCLTDVQSSCTNTDVITAYGSSSKYPAAWAAKNYKPTGTPNGKSWCLPSGGLLKDSLYNSTNLTRINAGILTAGGKKIGFGTTSSYERVWSSSEHSYANAWEFYATTDDSFPMGINGKDYSSYGSVRPVLAF